MVEVGPASVREGAARCPGAQSDGMHRQKSRGPGPGMLLVLGGSSSPELVGWFVVVGRVLDSRWRMARDLRSLFLALPRCQPGGGEPAKGAMGV